MSALEPHSPTPAASTLDLLASAFTASALRVTLAFGVVNSLFFLLIAAVGNPSPQRVVLAAGFVAVWAAALWRHRFVERFAGGWPYVLIALTALSAVPIAIDGGRASVLHTEVLPLVWVAAVVASPRITLATGVTYGLALIAGVLLGGLSLGAISRGGNRYDVVSTAANGIEFAIVGLLLVGTFRSIVARGPDILAGVRRGEPATTPALGAVIRGEPLGLLLAPASRSDTELTRAERDVVTLLAEGLAPKQIALARGTSLATVRTQIKHAKRKTGARTLDELVAIAWHPS